MKYCQGYWEGGACDRTKARCQAQVFYSNYCAPGPLLAVHRSELSRFWIPVRFMQHFAPNGSTSSRQRPELDSTYYLLQGRHQRTRSSPTASRSACKTASSSRARLSPSQTAQPTHCLRSLPSSIPKTGAQLMAAAAAAAEGGWTVQCWCCSFCWAFNRGRRLTLPTCSSDSTSIMVLRVRHLLTLTT